MRLPSVVLAAAAAALTACSAPPAAPDAPDAPAAPASAEACDVVGDEDGNGLADCDDPACADAAACRPVCGNGRLEAGEACDDGNATNSDGCERDCTRSAIAYLKASNTGYADQFGWSIALSADGSTLAVGTSGEDSAATGIDGDQASEAAQESGAVYVFVRRGSTWVQQAYVKASNTGPFDHFGRSVALSADGSMLAVGASGESSAATGVGGNEADNAAPYSGAVYVFTRSGGTWRQAAYVKASNTGGNDRFGESVALSADGSILAVGAFVEDSAATGVGGDQADNSADGSGAVYVFARSGGTWSQEAYIKASNTGAEDHFGYKLALSADGATLAVGAYAEASAATGIDGDQLSNAAEISGAVYVFARSGGTWSQQAYVKASNTAVRDVFGISLALSGDGATLAVGAVGEDSAATGINGDQADNSANGSGAAYVFARSGTTWSQQAYVKASNTGIADQFGRGVALSADGLTLVVGAISEASAATGVGGNQADNAAPQSGAAYVFVRSGTTWSQASYVKASNTGSGDFFGIEAALSGDGGFLAVAAIREDSEATGIGGDQASNATADAGAVYVFDRAAGLR
jgi:trimeric autotransporter adhesin